MDGGQTLLHETKVSEGLTLITVPLKSGSHANKESRIFSQEKVKPKTL